MDGRGVLIARAVSVVFTALVIAVAGWLLLRPVDGTMIGLMRLELLFLTAVLIICIMFFERIAVRLIRTRGGRLRGPRL
ncbi:MAG: hypothetical protein ACMVO5_08485 [Polymorphobacter sp.]|uniref:hypothetical protein n=1 Tax=Polymorphobacter sp. TaxID=1909290 RepID=UPI003A88494E